MKKQKFLLVTTLLLALVFNACKEEEELIVDPNKCTIFESSQIVIDDLNTTYAYPFMEVNPSGEDDALRPLIDYLGDASFVGLGEGTHGTSEFYKMKDQIFRALVTQKGFKAIVFELPWGNALKVNDFVTKGIGTAQSVMSQTFYWVYNTQEVIDLVQWIHDYNIDLPDEDKIHFVGNDPQGGDFKTEKEYISDYLELVQPDSVNSVMLNYKNLPTDLFDYVNEDQSIKDANIVGTQMVYDYFLEHRDIFVTASSEFEYEVALMATHVIKSREFIYRTGDSGTARDSGMAEYSEWWQRILGEDTKVAIWAHNGHVIDGTSVNVEFMGTFLRRRHMSNYINVGFSFGKGQFNAFRAGPNFEFLSGVRTQTIENVVCNTTNQILSEVEGDRHYIIFDELTGPAFQYFDRERGFLQIGSGFGINYIKKYVVPRRISRMFDVMIHFDETTASVLK